MRLLNLLQVVLTLKLVIGENVLVVHPVYSGSHVNAVRKILEKLVHRGHQVRVIRWLESSNIPVINNPEFSETVLSVNNSDGTIPFMTKEDRAFFQFPGKLMWNRGLNPLSVFDGGMQAVAASCDALLGNKALMKELKNGDFGIAIIDIIYNECGLALAHHLGVPVVGYWAFFFMSGEAQYTTAFNPPSVIPHTYLSFDSEMNFFHRVVNFLFGIGSHLVMQIHFSYTDYYIQKHLPGSPSSSELISNISGMLINSHPSLDYPMALPPSFFQIGGLHIENHRSLERDLTEFVESAKDGVILFSLGLNFDSEWMSSEIFNSYFHVFGQLKQKVIFKSKNIPPKVPANVFVMSHVPQCDILAHPNTVLFITHCGMHGVMEAIHHGVKMVGIPVFFDQVNVAARLKEKGVAVVLNKQAGSTEIMEAINIVINDSSYEKNMKQLNKLYHHSLENPLSRAVWLVEHVLEFRGADHLRMDSKDFNFFQYFSIDVVAFLIVIAAFSFGLTIKLFLYFYNFNKRNKYKEQ